MYALRELVNKLKYLMTNKRGFCTIINSGLFEKTSYTFSKILIYMKKKIERVFNFFFFNN